MIPNNNLSILPFYTDKSKQSYQKDYAFGEIFPLFTPDRLLLPFQIIRDHRTEQITSAILWRKTGELQATLTTKIVSSGLTIKQYNSYGYDVIVYPGILPMDITTPEGHYYLEISDGVQTWYSDIFTIVRKVDEYLKITYWDDESLLFDNGRIDYSDPVFKWKLYLPTQVGRPEYEFEEEVERVDGYTFVEKQISEKTYKFTFIAPEYLLDAMRIIRMTDHIKINSKNDEYDVDQFLITPKWQNGGFLASVEAEFQCNTVIKKIGKAITPQELGDYNNDYNNDYLNS